MPALKKELQVSTDNCVTEIMEDDKKNSKNTTWPKRPGRRRRRRKPPWEEADPDNQELWQDSADGTWFLKR